MDAPAVFCNIVENHIMEFSISLWTLSFHIRPQTFKVCLKCHRLQMALNNGRATLLSICLEHVHLATIQPRSLNKPGSGWHYSSETNSRESIGPFEKESYSCTRIKFKAAINLNLNGMLFLVFGPKCEQTSIPTLRISWMKWT